MRSLSKLPLSRHFVPAILLVAVCGSLGFSQEPATEAAAAKTTTKEAKSKDAESEATGAESQPDFSGLIGKRVVAKRGNVEFRLPEGVVAVADLGSVYLVNKVNKDWLWVRSAGGWVNVRDVVPFDMALKYFTDRMEKNPTAQTLFERGVVRIKLGNPAKALEDINEAIRNSKTAEYYNGRGLAFQALRDYDKSMADHAEAIRLRPKLSSAYYNRGNVYKIQRNFKQAIDDYNQAIALNPKNPRSYINRGQCYEQLGEFQKAIDDCATVIKISPRSSLAYNNRADALNSLGKHDEAIKDCNRAIKLDDTFPWPYVNRGNAHNAQKNYDEALADFDKAISLNPHFAPAYFNRGNTRMLQQMFDDALDDYNRALNIDSENPEALNGLAWLRATCPVEKFRDGKEAVRLAEKAVGIDRRVWNHVGTLAAAYAEAGDQERAIKAQLKVLQMLPGDVKDDERRGCQERLALFRSGEAYRFDVK